MGSLFPDHFIAKTEEEILQCGPPAWKQMKKCVQARKIEVRSKQPQKQVSVYFNSQGHSLNDLKVQVLYQNFRDKFSRKLGTVFPEDMNIDGGIVTKFL